MRARLALGIIGALGFGVGTTIVMAQTPRSMQAAFDALLRLTPLSLEDATFGAPTHRAEIDEALRSLADNADAIDAHGAGFDITYDRVRRTFAGDAREALESFDDGEVRFARFIVRNLNEDCFACHTRLPAGDRADLAERFRASIDLERVPRRDRVRLLTATRQFEAAREEAESLMRDRTVSAAAIDMMGTFEDYLKVCLRVERDFQRVRTSLGEFRLRTDLPVYLQVQVDDWLEALDEVEALDTSDRLAAAESLLAEARERNLYLQDRRGLVHATLASGLLHEYVLTAPPDGSRTSRAYYLLGLAEASISHSIWVPETEYFLELAIRTAPRTETARAAYVFLEQFVIANYTGSAGTDMPEEVRARLAELRELAGS